MVTFDPRFSRLDDAASLEAALWKIVNRPLPDRQAVHIQRLAALKAANAAQRKRCQDCELLLAPEATAMRCTSCHARRQLVLAKASRVRRRERYLAGKG